MPVSLDGRARGQPPDELHAAARLVTDEWPDLHPGHIGRLPVPLVSRTITGAGWPAAPSSRWRALGRGDPGIAAAPRCPTTELNAGFPLADLAPLGKVSLEAPGFLGVQNASAYSEACSDSSRAALHGSCWLLHGPILKLRTEHGHPGPDSGLTVPNGRPSFSAISLWLKPP